MNYDNLCMGCMNELHDETQCPVCGYNVSTSQKSPYLQVKTLVGGKYLVGKVMSFNSEGISYLAYDVERKTPVVLREFLPEGLVVRSFDDKSVTVLERQRELYDVLLSKFIALWRNLARIRGFSALIPVNDIFEENNTAYSVTEYIESITLRDFLLRSRTGYLNWEKANQLFMPVLSLLSCLHELGIVHYGISPDTLLVGRDGKMRLSGFSVKEYRFGGENIAPEIFDGYAPLEQYKFSVQHGAWSDVYAFCAVIYRSLVGSVPQDAVARSTSDKLIIPARYAEIIPAYVINALMNGLQIDPVDRTRNVEILRDELSATPSNVASSYSGVNVKPEENNTTAAPVVAPPVYVVEEEESTNSTILKTFLIILGVGLVIFAGWMIGSRLIKAPEETPEETTTEVGELIEVPNFLNTEFELVAQNKVQNERFVIKSVYEYSSEIEKGYIVSQSIQAGERVEMGTEITFVVSKGPEYVVVPVVKDLTIDEGRAILEDAGFKVETIEKLNDGSHLETIIANVIPEEGSEQIKGSTITVEVWGAVTEGETDEFIEDDIIPGISIDGLGDLFNRH